MNNIRKEGNSWRVQFQKNGKRFSKNFTKKKDAIAYRNANV